MSTVNTFDVYRNALVRLVNVTPGGLNAVAAQANISAANLDQILKSVKMPSGRPRGVGPKVRDALTQTFPDWLATGVGSMDVANANVAAAQIGARRIPLIDYVQAGVWTAVADTFQPGDAEDWLLTDLDLSGQAFALQIKGDSMRPDFIPGDRVIIDPDVQPQAGDFVVAKNGDEEATFKKYRARGTDDAGSTIFELVPLNPDFETLRSDERPIRIVGVMVEHRKYRRTR